jgi:DNA-binding LacI/PurR family transcriptional regulator
MGHRTVNVHERLIRAGVVLANCQTTQKGLPCYVPDDEQGQYEGVRKLLEKGYRRPLCIHLPEGGAATSLRRKGMQRAFEEFNVAHDPWAEAVAYLSDPLPFPRQGIFLESFHDESPAPPFPTDATQQRFFWI